MAKFRYQARDKQGNVVSGIMHAIDEDELYRRLKEEDKYLIGSLFALCSTTIGRKPKERYFYLNSEFFQAKIWCNRKIFVLLGVKIIY